VASAELSDPGSARVRKLQRLARRSYRTEQRRFLAEGTQAVREAIAAHREGRARVAELLVASEARDRDAALVSEAARNEIVVTVASNDVVAALSETVTPQGIVAVVDYLDVELNSVIAAGASLVAVLADVRDPGNAGSAIRAADAAGADAIVFAGDSVDPYNGKVVRSSVGGLFHLPVAVGVTVDEAIDHMRGAGLRVLVADGAADVSLDDPAVRSRLSEPTAWVFGNEAWGVRPEIASLADEVVKIPVYGAAESLNLATAVALCLYASAREQRQN
jgi:TrmH family RNA methyltransferase